MLSRFDYTKTNQSTGIPCITTDMFLKTCSVSGILVGETCFSIDSRHIIGDSFQQKNFSPKTCKTNFRMQKTFLNPMSKLKEFLVLSKKISIFQIKKKISFEMKVRH